MLCSPLIRLANPGATGASALGVDSLNNLDGFKSQTLFGKFLRLALLYFAACLGGPVWGIANISELVGCSKQYSGYCVALLIAC